MLVTGGVVYNEGVRLAICDIFGLKEEELLCGEEGAVVSAAGIAACACHGKLAFDWKHPVRREVADEEQKRKALPRPHPMKFYAINTANTDGSACPLTNTTAL